MTDIPSFCRPYVLTYFKRGHYWHIDAVDDRGQRVAALLHTDGQNRPYMVTDHGQIENLYPTYSEACAVFLNILRQGR